MRIGAPSIGPAENDRTDQKPEVRSAAISRWGISFRTAVSGALMMLPSLLQAETPNAPIPSVGQLSGKAEQLHVLGQELQKVWKEVAEDLKNRDTELQKEYDRLIAYLTTMKYTGNVHQLANGWQELALKQFNGEEERDIHSVEGLIRCYDELEEILLRHSSVEPQPKKGTADAAFVCKDAHRINLEDCYRSLLLTDDAGVRLGLFTEERLKNPALTAEEYMDQLAKRLKTPEDLAMFFRLFMRYTIDTDNPNEPLRKGSRTVQSEYYQRPEETLLRVEDNVMLGDCDDWCILAQALLERMNKQAVIVYIHGETTAHFTCLWVDETSDGRFVGNTLCTGGLYRDCEHVSDVELLLYPSAISTVVSKGHATKEEAIKAAPQHFKSDAFLTLERWNNGMFQIQKPVSEWNAGETFESRVQIVSMDRLLEMLTKPQPAEVAITAGVAPPPPGE